MDNKRIKKEIERLRIANKMSQAELADRLGISQPAFHKIEKGETMLINEHLAELCQIFGVSEERLLLGYCTDNSDNNTTLADKEVTEYKKEIEILRDRIRFLEENINMNNVSLREKELIIDVLKGKSETQDEMIKILRDKLAEKENAGKKSGKGDKGEETEDDTNI